MNDGMPLLVRLLCDPEIASQLKVRDWNDILPQARRTVLGATLKSRIQACGLEAKVPVEAWHHLESAFKLYDKQCQSVTWEINKLQQIFSSLEQPVVLLKGAAYYAQKINCYTDAYLLILIYWYLRPN